MSESEQNTHLVFVYGSLKMGFGNHGVLQYSGAEPVAEGMTLHDGFSMESLGGFPGVYADGDMAIWGEVYEVTDEGLAACDRLEGHPRFYQRHEVEIVTDEGDIVTAWMYILPSERLYRHGGRERVEIEVIDGIKIANWIEADWKRWVRNRN